MGGKDIWFFVCTKKVPQRPQNPGWASVRKDHIIHMKREKMRDQEKLNYKECKVSYRPLHAKVNLSFISNRLVQCDAVGSSASNFPLSNLIAMNVNHCTSAKSLSISPFSLYMATIFLA